MYTDIFLGDAPEAAQPWISSHVAARTTTFTLTDGSVITAEISGNLDNSAVARCVSDLSCLKEVVIGSTVTSINTGAGQLSTGAFDGCGALEKVVVQRDTYCIDSHAFAQCARLSSVTLPNSISSIGEKAFFECSSLREIELPCNVDKVCEGTFGNCASLEKITFGKKVSYFAPYSLARLPNLKKLVFKHRTMDEVKAIDGFSNLSSVGCNFEVEAIDGSFKFEEEESDAMPSIPGIGDIVGPGGSNN